MVLRQSLFVTVLIFSRCEIVATLANRNITSKCGENERIFEKTGKCYRLHTHCPVLMEFYDVGNGYGDCDCQVSIDWPLIYWRPHNRCYHVFKQGPCRQGYWIVLDPSTSNAICQRNPCLHVKVERSQSQLQLDYYTPPVIVFFRYGKCWKTLTRAYCSPNEKVINSYDLDGRFGVCQDTRQASAGPSGDSIPCRPGNKFSVKHSLCIKLRTISYDSLF